MPKMLLQLTQKLKIISLESARPLKIGPQICFTKKLKFIEALKDLLFIFLNIRIPAPPWPSLAINLKDFILKVTKN